jgi:hypothetical protein
VIQAWQIVVGLAHRLHQAQKDALGKAPLTLVSAIFALAVFSVAHLARLGTSGARLGAAAILVALGVGAVLVYAARRSRWRNARAAVRRVVSADDPELGAAIDRAAGLAFRLQWEGDSADPASRELAELHLLRQLSKIDVERIAERSERAAGWIGGGALAAAAIALAVVAVEPFRVLEGLDVLVARDGEAPLGLVYLDDVDVVAAPPAYIGRHEEPLEAFDRTEQPRGTVLTVRGKPQRAGRTLVLTDGNEEVPFIEDGKGMLLARWTLGDTTELRVAARFGGVRISQRDTLTVDSIADLSPVVLLEGAPKTVRLVDTPSVSLKYEATDDHGLREIALVLRSGPNEERRTLSKPTDSKTERGAHELSTREPFFRKSYVPVEVSIEAKDNDAVLGPKWGKSAAFIVVPPLVGEPEALRYAALLRARDALVDLAAARVTTDVASEKDAKALVDPEREAQKKAEDVVETVLAASYGGLGVRGRARHVIAGQLRRLRESFAAFEKEPGGMKYGELRSTTEDVVLAVDAAIQSVGLEDARRVSKLLAAVADEAAAASHTAQDVAEIERGRARLAAALEVLSGGGKQLAELGDLGADLGDIVRGGVRRIGRERDVANYKNAELAAKDLADRLRTPLSSIGGGGKPGVESGVGDGSGVDQGDASGADEAAESGAKELDELIQRHQDELDKVEQALKSATTEQEREALKKLAKEQADAIRDAVKDLPENGLRDSAAEKAAEGRKRAESMSGALEQGNVKEAIRAGKEALEALREAQRRGEKESDAFFDNEEVGKAAKRAGNRLDEALDALKNELEKAEKAAKDRAQGELRDAGANERRLAEKTGDLRRRGEKGDASMPEDMLDRLEQAEQAMREAQKALEEGDAQVGQDKQREAQRLLEMARGDDDGRDRPKVAPKDAPEGEGDRMDQDAEVPDKDRHKGPEAFRKRVIDGLGKPGDARLKDAVKRYTEGLLK